MWCVGLFWGSGGCVGGCVGGYVGGEYLGEGSEGGIIVMMVERIE